MPSPPTTTSTQPPPPATVVIAGGGIVGLVLALALKKHVGIIAEIYEKASHFADEVGAGLGMYPNGLRVLRDIDPQLLHDVRQAGSPYNYRRWERHDGTEISMSHESVLARQEDELTSTGIRRWRLQKILQQHVLAAGIPIYFNKGTQTAIQHPATSDGSSNDDDTLVEVMFEDGTSRWTRILFGCDGAKSQIRTVVCGGEEQTPQLKYVGVTCLMGLAERCPNENGICFPSAADSNVHAVFFPTGPTEQCFQFHFHLPENEADPGNWGNLNTDVGREECRVLADRLKQQGWHERYLQPLYNVAKAVRVGFCLLERPLERWVNGRIALVGDAGHPPVPYLGQGAQMGLEDAGVITMLIKLFCCQEPTEEPGEKSPPRLDFTNFEKVMKLYQDIRIKRALQILELSKSFGAEQHERCDREKAENDEMFIKGEVLMYGTMPIMFTGADHDYKDDVTDATKERKRTMAEQDITPDQCLKALEEMFCSSGVEKATLSTNNKNMVPPWFVQRTRNVSEDDARQAFEMLHGICI